MEEKRLHIVCFDIPYPANYGGAIDVYYRIKALAEAGVGIVLHCTYKGKLTHYAELENLCEKVYYYPRTISLCHLISRLPLAVVGRSNKEILRNLLHDDAPILYEGLVSCGTMDAQELVKRKKYFRECNVEHDYYRALAQASHNLRNKIYYLVEAGRLERFERVLEHADGIFALAHQDEAHFVARFPKVKTAYVPCFHAHDKVLCPTGIGKGILYHGNLRVEENIKAAEFIISEIAPKLPEIPFTIAGMGADKLKTYSNNVNLVSQPDKGAMVQLVRNAQVHLLVTFQATGLKLKLLNVLYEGRHVVCNPEMVCGTELSELCHIGKDTEELIEQCKAYYQQAFTNEMTQERQNQLELFDNTKLSQQILIQIFTDKQ